MQTLPPPPEMRRAFLKARKGTEEDMRAFRERYPKFNGLIWGYHWLQVGLYEPLVTGRNRAERQRVISAV